MISEFEQNKLENIAKDGINSINAMEAITDFFSDNELAKCFYMKAVTMRMTGDLPCTQCSCILDAITQAFLTIANDIDERNNRHPHVLESVNLQLTQENAVLRQQLLDIANVIKQLDSVKL